MNPNNVSQNMPDERNFINLYKSKEENLLISAEKHQICQLYKFENNRIIRDISYLIYIQLHLD